MIDLILNKYAIAIVVIIVLLAILFFQSRKKAQDGKPTEQIPKKHNWSLFIAIGVIVILASVIVYQNFGSSEVFSFLGKDKEQAVKSSSSQKSGFLDKVIEKSHCGNQECERGEDSSSCCIDCGCPSGYSCDGSKCTKLSECGNGILEEGETSQNCCKDAGCSSGFKCENNRCIELIPELETKFENTNVESITYYKAQKRQVGILTITNKGNSDAKDIQVKISSPNNYFNNEVVSVGTIKKGSSAIKQISLIFTDNALDISTRTQIKLNLDLSFNDEDNRGHKDSETGTFYVMGKNYMRWTNPDTIASWITPNHPIIKEFASKATAGLAAGYSGSTSKEQELAARWLLESMRAYGIQYANDPFNMEADFVQFPTELLKNRGGDCEDNAVLYASLLAAIGMEPVFFLTPGHAFAGYKNKEGQYVPIETTSLDFDTALAAGINNLQQNQGNYQVIELNWGKNPQVILPTSGNLQLPSITKNIGECKVSFNLQDFFVASVPITFTNSGSVPGAGCAIATIYEEGGTIRDEKVDCWTIQPQETKTVTFQPDISVFSGYYCVAK